MCKKCYTIKLRGTKAIGAKAEELGYQKKLIKSKHYGGKNDG